MNKHSPEEKLLNLIKKADDKKNASLKSATAEKESEAKQEEKIELVWEDLVEPWSLYKLNSYEINKYHKILIGVAFSLFVYALFTFLNYFIKDSGFTVTRGKLKVAPEEIKKDFSLQPFSNYEIIKKKKLFKLYEKAKISPHRMVSPQEAVTIAEKLRTISLVGIIWDEGRPQAIIEERKSRNTSYVYEGDVIGEIQIVKIEQGKVIFSYGDEEGELKI